MHQNRNSLRSINMIKSAFLEILKNKNISKITVKEVTDLANLTRNTFYAHFVDVYAVNESIENEVIAKTIELMNKMSCEALFDNTLLFFKEIMRYIDENKIMVRALLENGTAATFINKYSTTIIEYVLNNISSIKVSDKKGFESFLNILFTGSVFLIKQYLEGKSSLSIEEIAITLNNIFVHCYELYI